MRQKKAKEIEKVLNRGYEETKPPSHKGDYEKNERGWADLRVKY